MAPTTTLCFVDTRNHVLTRAAVEISMFQHPFTRALVVTDRPEQFDGFDTVRIDPFPSMAEYNRYLLTGLVEHLTTDVMVTAHFDGFVINGNQYSPHFAHYDYIGAPWPMWEEHAVGNGGFSWRSRKLMETVARLPYDGVDPEDVFICRTMRALLEDRHQVRFAGREIASHFSQELVSRPYPSFGFHGIFHLPSVYAGNLDFLLDNLTPHQLCHPAAGPLLAQALGRVSPAAQARFESLRRQALAVAA